MLPDSVIEQIRSEMGGKDLREVDADLEVGNEIEVVTGPFRGMEGIVTRLLSGGERVKVLMEMFGEYNEIELGRETLGTGAHPRASLSP